MICLLWGLLAFVEGLIEIVFLGLMGTLTLWTYVVEWSCSDSIVVIRHLDLIGVSFDKIRYKGLGFQNKNFDNQKKDRDDSLMLDNVDKSTPSSTITASEEGGVGGEVGPFSSVIEEGDQATIIGDL